MFVIERSGVGWAERFYAGKSTFSPIALWGNLDEAHKFEDKRKAVRASYRVDEEGHYTTVEEYSKFEINSL